MGCLAERRGNGPERRGEPPILSVRPAGNYGGGAVRGDALQPEGTPGVEGPDVQVAYLGGDGVRHGGAPDVPVPAHEQGQLAHDDAVEYTALPISTAMGVAGRTWSAAQRSRMVFRMPSTAGYSA